MKVWIINYKAGTKSIDAGTFVQEYRKSWILDFDIQFGHLFIYCTDNLKGVEKKPNTSHFFSLSGLIIIMIIMKSVLSPRV